MLSLYRTLSLPYLRQRWSRAILVVASIALGVATLVATRALNQTMSQAVRVASAPLAGAADLHVSNGESPVRRDLAADLRQVPGVKGVEPLVFGRVRLPDLNDQRQVLLLGLVWRADSAESNPWDVEVDWLIPPETVPGLLSADTQNLLTFLKKFDIRPVLVGDGLAVEVKEVTLEEALKEKYPAVPTQLLLAQIKRRIGEDWLEKLKKVPIRIQAAGRDTAWLIRAGTVRARGPAADLVKNVLIMDAGEAAEFLGQPGMVNRIDLFLEAGADRGQVYQQVEAVLAAKTHEVRPEFLAGLAAAPSGSFPSALPWAGLVLANQNNSAQVHTPEANAEKMTEVMAGLQRGFGLCGAVALVVALFLVYNALAVSVAERRHEIGVLRSLGATRFQVCALFVGEAGLLGLAGAALGVPAGDGLAHLGLVPMQKVLSDLFMALEAHKVEIDFNTVMGGIIAGIVTAMVAALVPAVNASREQPAEAVRRIPPVPPVRHYVFLLVASLLLVATGATCILYRESLQAKVGTFGGLVLVLLGLLLLTPFLAAILARLFQPLARRFLGLQGRLAADNLVRSPGRTGLVITALAAGVAVILQTAGVIRSNEEAILTWVDKSIAADLFVSSGSAISGSDQNMPLQAEVGKKIEEAFPEIEAVLPVRSRRVDFGDKVVFLVALDAKGFYEADQARGSTVGRELYPRLYEDAQATRAIVSENFAALHGVKAGDTISLRGPHGPVPMEVVGTVVDYTFNRGTVIMDLAHYQQHFNDPLVDEFSIYLWPGADPRQIRESIMRRWGAQHALFVVKREEVQQHVRDIIRRLYGIAYAQEIVVGLVAALGVVMALLMSVLQRRRELGLLRAVGATRTQILRSVLAEATFMGVIGTVIGLLIGVPLEWYCVQVILFEEAGFRFPVLIPWLEAGIIAGVALATATLAGLGPAWLTSRLRIPEAIAYE